MKIRDEYQDLNMRQTIKKLKTELKNLGIKWGEEDNAIDGIEFILNYKGRYVIGKIGITYPYPINYRMIGQSKYKKINPKGFVNEMKTILIH